MSPASPRSSSPLCALVAGLGALGCGSPLLTLADLPQKELRVHAGTGAAGLVPTFVTVELAYASSEDLCGPLRSPSASLGGMKMEVLSPGRKTSPPPGSTEPGCDYPSFQTYFYSAVGAVPDGPLLVSDGLTTLSAQFSGLDPGLAKLVEPANGVLTPGQVARIHVAQPDGVRLADGFIDYWSGASNEGVRWLTGTSTAIDELAVTVPPTAAGAGTLYFGWIVDASTVACPSGVTCVPSASAVSTVRVTVGP